LVAIAGLRDSALVLHLYVAILWLLLFDLLIHSGFHLLCLFSQSLQDLVAKKPLVDACQKVAIKLSDILLVADLDAVAIIVDYGVQDTGRVGVLFVREGQLSKELLELQDEFLGLTDALLDHLVTAFACLLLLLLQRG